jgi:hypothetical protein
MITSQELRSYYKRMLCILKEIEVENPSPTLKKHIRAIEIEMDEEDVAYVEKKIAETR